jgi:hypothetical protein
VSWQLNLDIAVVTPLHALAELKSSLKKIFADVRVARDARTAELFILRYYDFRLKELLSRHTS